MPGEPSQLEVDRVVQRCRDQVTRHGGSSARLENLRTVYEMFQRRPDNCSYGMLLGILDKLERDL